MFGEDSVCMAKVGRRRVTHDLGGCRLYKLVGRRGVTHDLLEVRLHDYGGKERDEDGLEKEVR